MKSNNLILFGGNRDKENDPIIPLIKQALEKNFYVVLFTDPVHLKMKTKNNYSFKDILQESEFV